MGRCDCVVWSVGIPADDRRRYVKVGNFEYAKRDCLCGGSGDGSRWTFRALAVSKLADEKSPPPHIPLTPNEWTAMTLTERAEYLDSYQEELVKLGDWAIDLQRAAASYGQAELES